jgi:hypothetical protein
MKKIAILLLILTLLALNATTTCGATHSRYGDFTTFIYYTANTSNIGSDTWYSATPVKPFVKVTYYPVNNDPVTGDATSIYTEFNLNDQTFFGMGSEQYETAYVSITNFYFSYLFELGIFVGVDYYGFKDHIYDNAYTVSLGYRQDLGEQGYLAVSADFLSIPDADFQDVVSYDADFVYYFTRSYLFFQYFVPTEALELGIRIIGGDTVTLGLDYVEIDTLASLERRLYSAGLTWTPDFMIFDIQFGGDFEDASFYNLSLLFKAAESLHLGFEYLNENENNDAQIMAKIKYVKDDYYLIGGYIFENDSYPSAFFLNFKYNLKY